MGSKKQKQKANTLHIPPPEQDDGLLDDLLVQLESNNVAVQKEATTVLEQVEKANAATSKPKKNSKFRFKEREARKEAVKQSNYTPTDPLGDARLEQEAKEEEKSITHICDNLGLEIYEIQPDGHCLFAAVADQLQLLSLLVPSSAPYLVTRKAAADFILVHPDDFIPFLPSLEGEDGSGATEGDGLMTTKGLEMYCRNVRETATWGGEPEIMALSRAFNVPIHVIQWGTPSVMIHSPHPNHSPDGPVVRISYHRRMYGLGEHYNSLRVKRNSNNVSRALKDMMFI